MNELFESSYLNAMSEMNNKLREENNKLQSNWNSLKDWVFEHIDSIKFNSYDEVLDKMNELEGVENESNRYTKR